MPDHDVAIMGAGIVGTSAALWSALRGLDVVLIDADPPGSGTSSGNAGTIATYGCLPVNDPSVFRALPRLLFGRGSPLALSWRHALANPGWMLAFLANCRPARSTAIARDLARLLAQADAGLNPLIEEAGAGDLIVARGQITVWSTKEGAEGAAEATDRRRALGVVAEELSAADVAAMEPGLSLNARHGVFFPEARHVRDPAALVSRFHARFAELGGRTLATKVTRVIPGEDAVVLRTAEGEVSATRCVLAAGAFSSRIAGAGAEAMPLGTERGYHLRYAGEAHRVTRPVGWAEGGFYATPMASGLRLAGTVEIAALDDAPNAERLAYIAGRAREMFDGLPEATDHWLGFRPTLPDSRPVIGPSPASERILHAFGHQHLGLTLGGITGRIAADFAEGRVPNDDLRAFAPERFC